MSSSPPASVGTAVFGISAGWDLEPLQDLHLSHKCKWVLHRQLDKRLELDLRGMRQRSPFLGLINRAEYRLQLRSWIVAPQWKSVFRRQVPVMKSQAKRRELTELFMLIVRFPILRKSVVEAGIEYELFKQLRDPTPPGAEDSFTGRTTTVQWTNVSEYQGYRLTTTTGFEVRRLDSEAAQAETHTRGFITIYAGVEM